MGVFLCSSNVFECYLAVNLYGILDFSFAKEFCLGIIQGIILFYAWLLINNWVFFMEDCNMTNSIGLDLHLYPGLPKQTEYRHFSKELLREKVGRNKELTPYISVDSKYRINPDLWLLLKVIHGQQIWIYAILWVHWNIWC